jgi:hypothetical protein
MLTRRHHQLTRVTRNFAVGALLLAFAGCGGGGGGAQPGINNDSSSASTTLPNVPGWSQFVYPLSGQLGVPSGRPFQWTAVAGSQAYQLQVGTSAGGNDVFDSGAMATTSIVVPHLPASGTVYARVRAIPTGWSTALEGDYPRGTYVTFRADANVTGATFISPTQGATVDADTPVSWHPDPVALSYRLTIGSTMGIADLLDTGTTHSSQRVVAGLPAGATVYATLYTTYAQNIVRSQSVSFVVGNPNTTNTAMLTVARNLAAEVRGMADVDNQPYDGTPLTAATANEGDAVADCSAFTTTLLSALADANVPLQGRQLSVCFNTDSFDCHALAELFDSDTQRWITLDPTFGLYALSAQGQAATSAEISAAVRTESFDQLTFAYLTAAGDAYARAYYIDYPLLFLNVYQPGSTTTLVEAPPTSLQPYFDLLGASVDGAVSGFYAVQCASGYSSAVATWDGTQQSYPCTNGFTPILWALSVSTADPSATAVWRTHRFVF